MAIVRDHQGVKWLSGTMEAAERRDLIPELSDIALAYLSGHPTITYPDPSGQDRIRVVRNGKAVTLAPNGVVLAYDLVLGHEGPTPVSQGLPRAKGGRGGAPGPTDMAQVMRMAAAEGAEVSRVGSGHYKVSHRGKSVQVAATPRSSAGVANCVARLRRELGLRLR